MTFERIAGVILHPTSLPGRFGIGDLGAEALAFVDFMAAARQQLWQVLPLGPTGYGDSPYQSFSAFAGNPLLISLDRLVEEGFLPAAALADTPSFSRDRINYGAVMQYKLPLLKDAYAYFDQHGSPAQKEEFARFAWESGAWLHDYALFMALKEAHGGAPWYQWPAALKDHQQDALDGWEKKLQHEVLTHKFIQYLFFRQWSVVRQYANERHVRIMGDIPIFVAYDSCDLWANRHLFQLDEAGRPTVVAGVPPDIYSATGQLWGNPLYRWNVLAEQDYHWWIERFRATLQMVDVVRLDHFRGFEAYWEVPGDESTAVNGRWVKGPGAHFFQAMRAALGDFPIVVEDLGFLTPEVDALRQQFSFPGMKVLQFAFDGNPENAYLPHNYQRNCVVYTSTHDSDTALGWFQDRATPEERDYVLKYSGSTGQDFAWDFIRLAYRSVANIAMINLQDILRLGNEGRMNLPGSLGGNWNWRYQKEDLRPEHAAQLAEMVHLFGREGASA